MVQVGRRALRSGDLVVPKTGTWIELWYQPEGNLDSSDIVTRCRLGLLLGRVEVEWMTGKRVTKAMVFDGEHMKVGWCEARFLKRVE